MILGRGGRFVVGAVCGLALLVGVDGCKRHRKTRSKPNTEAFAQKIDPLVKSNKLAFLKIPDIGSYQPLVQTFYDDRNEEIAWTRMGSRRTPLWHLRRPFRMRRRRGSIRRIMTLRVGRAGSRR